MFDHSRPRGLASCAEEFLGVIDGENCTGPIPQGVRKRLRKDGTLKMFGSRYEVTPPRQEDARDHRTETGRVRMPSKRSYRLRCPREGIDVTLSIENDEVGFSCPELKLKFIKLRKLEFYYLCKIRSNECPYEEITYSLLKKIEPESYLTSGLREGS